MNLTLSAPERTAAFWSSTHFATFTTTGQTVDGDRWRPCPACLRAGYDPTLHDIVDPDTGETRQEPVGWPNAHRHGRPEQLVPPGNDWETWVALAGRAWGKTRSAGEEAAERLMVPGTRGFGLAARLEDARTVMAEGESGLLAILAKKGVTLGRGAARFDRQTVELWLPNGSYWKGFGSEKPDSEERFRGPQWHFGWVDEPGSMRYGLACLTMAEFGLRLGRNRNTRPQVLVTGTPRRVGLIRHLLKKHRDNPTRTRLVVGRTLDNAANLSAGFVDRLVETYGGTALGEQELNGVLLDDVDGALWRTAWLDRHRINIDNIPGMLRVVVALDTAASNRDTADEFGIIVAGLGLDGCVYVLADHTCRGLPRATLTAALNACEPWRFPTSRLGVSIVIESNLIPAVFLDMLRELQAERGSKIPVKPVRAAVGKETRAEPVAMLYDVPVDGKPKVRHVGWSNTVYVDGKATPETVLEPGDLAKVEDELVTWVPSETKKSPNRLDALVWAVTDLALGPTGTASKTSGEREQVDRGRLAVATSAGVPASRRRDTRRATPGGSIRNRPM